MHQNYQFSILLVLTLSITMIFVIDFAFAQLEVTTYAGNGVFGIVNGDALKASFYAPEGIAIASNGDVYVSDSLDSKIRIIYVNGTVATYAGSTNSGDNDGDRSSSSFLSPRDLAIDGDGNLYVADTQNHKIRIIYSNGTVATYAGNGTNGSKNGDALNAQFYNPNGIAIDSDRNVYVADTDNHVVRVIYTNKTVATYAGIPKTSGSTNGDLSNALFNKPYDIAISSNKDVYVADTVNHKIRIIYANGIVATYAGSIPGTADGHVSSAKFSLPFGLTITANDDLYVTEQNGHRIRIIYTDNDTVSTYAGSSIGYVDGALSSAKFNYPSHVAIANNGDIYVTDFENRRIRKISTPDTPPVITLNGSSTITLQVGDTYTELGATTDDGSNVTIGGDTVIPT